MIDITILTTDPFKKDFTERVIRFCLRKLLPNIRNLTIIVDFEKTNLTKKEYAYCFPLEERKYIITCSIKTKMADLIRWLCHEMVHVKQFVTHQIYLTDDVKRYYWRGKEVNNVSYWNDPCEKEAYKLDTKLAKEFLLECDI